MIAPKLVHLILSHEEAIVDRADLRIRRDPEMKRIRTIVGPGLRQYHRELLEGLERWFATGNTETLAQQYRHLGKARFEQRIPLHECIKNLCIVKEELLDFVGENTFNKNSLDLYAEEELDRVVGRFFDRVIVYLVQGYESIAMKGSFAVSA
jgi:hypothetical protein